MNAAMQHLQLTTSPGSPIIRIAMGPEGTNFAFIELRTEEVLFNDVFIWEVLLLYSIGSAVVSNRFYCIPVGFVDVFHSYGGPF